MAYLGLSARGGWTAVRRFPMAAVVLWLALPLSAQSGGLTDAVRNALKVCQDAYIACGRTCAGPTCAACETIRDACRAEAYSAIAPAPPRTPAGWVMAGSTPVFLPKIPGISIPTMPRPYPSPQPHPTPRPTTPPADPRAQTSEYCSANQIGAIADRYQAKHGGGPTADSLLQRVEGEQAALDSLTQEWNATANDPDASRSERKEAKENLERAVRQKEALEGAKKLLGELALSSPVDPQQREEVLIALNETLDELMEDGIKERGAVADYVAGDNGTDADVIRSAHTGYRDKQNALAGILADYGKGSRLDDIVQMAERTGEETLVSKCRGEQLPPIQQAGGGAAGRPGECQGESYDNATQCCTADGIGTRADRNMLTIRNCPPEQRVQKPNHVPKSNGCAPAWITTVTNDRPDNPNYHRVGLKRTKVYYGPSFLPACDFHDICWGTCHSADTGLNQATCDVEFGRRLNSICVGANLAGDDLTDCQANARDYQSKVSSLTRPTYDPPQAEACHCCEGAG